MKWLKVVKKPTKNMFTFSHLYTPLIAEIADFPRDGMIEVRRPSIENSSSRPSPYRGPGGPGRDQWHR